MSSDEQLRLSCLELASKCVGPIPESVLNAAKQFYEFVIKARTAPDQPTE